VDDGRPNPLVGETSSNKEETKTMTAAAAALDGCFIVILSSKTLESPEMHLMAKWERRANPIQSKPAPGGQKLYNLIFFLL